MRLIDTQTLELSEFFDSTIPSFYVIVSHTWGYEELTFQDWLYIKKKNPPRWGWVRNDKEIDQIKSRAGYIKIKKACQQAQRDGYDWVWIDTICIDKTSPAELSEAINSMFRWYTNAAVCYVFLADVPNLSPKDCNAPTSHFRRSRWFRRGWTLQELIGPKKLEFFSRDWARIGSRKDLVDLITEITTVPQDCLEDSRFLRFYTVATKMSWASRRETSRAEDIAYSLLGIFNVQMPLLYGEGGENAFIRLQEEIIKEITDHSMLAWRRLPPLSNSNSGTWGILATHPSQFEHATNIQDRGPSRDPISMTSDGQLRIQLPVLQRNGFAIAILECGIEGNSDLQLGILIAQHEMNNGSRKLFPRIPHWSVYQVSPHEIALAQVRTIYLFKRDIHCPTALQERLERKEAGLIRLPFNDNLLGFFPLLSTVFPGLQEEMAGVEEGGDESGGNEI
jgi:Heterokaryon incompatibility protein (HET)